MKTRLSKWFVVAALVLMAGGLQAESFRPLTVYLLRHAETMANVTRIYSDENQNTFSPRGLEQIERLPARLAALPLDAVFVSPDRRALRSIAPCLKAAARTAEIWPEIGECCWETEPGEPTGELRTGEPIELEEELAPFFTFRDENAHRTYDAASPESGLLMAQRATRQLREQFGGSGQTILLVTHYHTGRRLLEALLPPPHPKKLRLLNARLSCLVEQPDGTFRLVLLNDLPHAPDL